MEATFGRSSTKGGLNHIQDLGRRSRETLICWKLLTYFYRQISKAESLEAYLAATPHIRPAVPPELTTSTPVPSRGTSTQSRDDSQALLDLLKL
ncbi:hypothetical protein N7505_004926 [Penicillium chrysogenum]|uniref:Uncharacterized protein n=2 Tax=Penicillium chrysogenum TaxID=5076 RepID=A0ABQ8WGH0_PENCH|nr:hypothetical protein N7505_004926 [Penicillium chrysogenum]